MGRKKLPKIAGIAGITKRKIMITPCSVKRELYISGPIMVLPADMSSVRNNMPKIMARISQKMMAQNYIRPRRL